MQWLRLVRMVAAVLVAACCCLLGSAAFAQTTLRIGLAEDPDVLDPTLARTYVGRIVFASLCDKLFDIDDKLNIVPQLALSQRDLRGRQDRHHQAAAGRQVPRRRGHGRGGGQGQPRAAHDHAGLIPQARARRRRQGRGGRRLDRAAAAEEPVLTAASPSSPTAPA